MKKRKFAIQSLALAGFLAPAAQGAVPSDEIKVSPEPSRDTALFDIFSLPHTFILAGHRSHSSHRSHGSHRSSAGGGGGRAAPSRAAPTPTPAPRPQRSESTPPASILPKSSTAPKTLPGSSDKFTEIVRRVQAGLYAYGYYTGAIDGVVGPETKTALMKFQTNFGLPVTGTVTPEVLNALGITAQ